MSRDCSIPVVSGHDNYLLHVYNSMIVEHGSLFADKIPISNVLIVHHRVELSALIILKRLP